MPGRWSYERGLQVLAQAQLLRQEVAEVDRHRAW